MNQNFFKTQKFESLQAMVYWLDGLKTLWYQAELAKNLNNNLFAAARKVQAELDALALYGTIPTWMQLPEEVPEGVEAYIELSDNHPLAGEIKSFMEMSTDDYPWWISFGAFWNEIENPDFLESLIDQMGSFFAEQPDSGCLGSERAVIGKTYDGMAAVSYYDIGSEFLVFKDEAAMDAFEEEEAVEPSEHFIFSGNGWFGR